MSIHKYKDWRGWWDGLRSKAMKAGAEAIVTNVSGLFLTNGVAATIPALHPVGMSWETAVATTLVQFIVRIVVAAATYIQNKPDPDIVEEELKTEFVTKPDPTIKP